MAIDADGAEFTKTNPGKTDQRDTSLRYPLHGEPSLDADKVPYIVLPGSGIKGSANAEKGDLAAVVYRDKLVFAIVGDYGPPCKIGEGSIQLHELLGHKGCRKRDQNGVCQAAANDSIDHDVLYFVFPGTKAKIYGALTPENINQRIETEGKKFWESLRGAYQR